MQTIAPSVPYPVFNPPYPQGSTITLLAYQDQEIVSRQHVPDTIITFNVFGEEHRRRAGLNMYAGTVGL